MYLKSKAYRILTNSIVFSLAWTWAKNAIVTVGNDAQRLAFWSTQSVNYCGYRHDVLNEYYTVITCGQPIKGQFVQIMLQNAVIITFYEVEVLDILNPQSPLC